MSAAAAVTLRCCGNCRHSAFLLVKVESQFYLRCATCHANQLKFPLDTPGGALVNIEDVRCMNFFIPGSATITTLLKAYRQCAAELQAMFEKHPEVLS